MDEASSPPAGRLPRPPMRFFRIYSMTKAVSRRSGGLDADGAGPLQLDDPVSNIFA